MHWSKSSNKAYKSGRYFPTKKRCIEIPERSAAAREGDDPNARNGLQHGPRIWFSDEEVVEHSIYSEEYGKTLTVLILSNTVAYKIESEDCKEEALLTDTYSNFVKNGQFP